MKDAKMNKSGRKRIWAFKIIAIFLPVLLIFLIEAFLRASNYGDDMALFRSDVTGKYFYLNPQVGKRYFTNIKNSTNGNIDFFPKSKTVGAYRIFVLGSSTSLGFPYMYNGAFPRMLKYKLQRLYPEKNIEVINLSLSAINSYAVLDMAKEVVSYQPDAVIIYCGQNEYHGALGIASSGSFGSSSLVIKTFIWSKKSRLMQLLYNLLYINKKNDISNDLHRTLMERLAFGQKVEFGSKKYKRGIVQFENNISEVLELFNKNKVPVFIGNLVSNCKDLHPFASNISHNDTKTSFDRIFKEANEILQHGDSIKALTIYQKALSIDSFHAECCYRVGSLAYSAGNYSKARVYLLKAKEYDNLRFRAPEEFSRFIETVSQKYNNTHFVDVCAAFEKESPHGIVGNELLLEHVHPNLIGYSVMADAFLNSLVDVEFKQVPTINDLSYSIISQQLPISKFDTIYGYISNILLKENWPFNEPLPIPTDAEKSFEGKVAGGVAVKQFSWEEAMEKLFEHYIDNHQNKDALKIAEGLCLEFPYQVKYYEMAAKLSLQIGDDDRYFFYILKIWMGFTRNYELAEQLFITALKNDKPELSIPFLEYGIQNTNKGNALKPIKLSAEHIIKLKAKLQDNDDNIDLLNQIAGIYIMGGNLKAGKKYVDKVLVLDANNYLAKGFLAKIHKTSNHY